MARVDVEKSKRVYQQLKQAVRSLDNPVARSYLEADRPAPERVRLGEWMLERTPWETFNVLTRSGVPVHEDLYSIVAALAIIENLNTGTPDRVPGILAAEAQYARHLFDCRNLSRIIARDDPQRRDILCSKLDQARHRLQDSEQQIKRWRILQDRST